MEIKTLYKVISGESAEIERLLNTLSRDGWRPITMSCRSSVLTVILENKAMGRRSSTSLMRLARARQERTQ